VQATSLYLFFHTSYFIEVIAVGVGQLLGFFNAEVRRGWRKGTRSFEEGRDDGCMRRSLFSKRDYDTKDTSEYQSN
jgi:hypothetical protein